MSSIPAALSTFECKKPRRRSYFLNSSEVHYNNNRIKQIVVVANIPFFIVEVT